MPFKNLIIHGNIGTIPRSCFLERRLLKSVVLEDGVKAVGENAFAGCDGLETVKLPETLEKINSDAFASGLNEIYIPKNVTSIGKNAIGYSYNPDNWRYTLNTNFKIFGHTGTAAETYAENNKIAFYDVDNLYNIEAKGGSLRLTAPALRFGFRINATALPLDDVELGFVYCYGQASNELTLENVGNNGTKKKTASNIEFCSGYANYNLVFTKIPETALEGDITVRAYAIAHGYVYYSNPITRNAKQVARDAITDLDNSQETVEKIKELYKV